MADVKEVQRRFDEFSRTAAEHLPLYRHLAAAVGRDGDVAERVLLAPVGQRQPVLLLAAVHDVLLAGEEDPLRQWYSSVVSQPRSIGAGADDPWPHFRRLALDHEGVAERLRTRTTQTNEVGRCATILPALARVAADAPGAPPNGARPLGLVELGASAGLNLLLDRYGYRYRTGRDGHGRVIEVQATAALVLECQVRGQIAPPVPDDVPHVAARIGVDLHPVDLGDRDQARWLVACQWPDQPERIHRARTAIALGRGDPPRVVAGDLVDELPHLLATVPPHALPVLVATWALSYLSVERRRDLLAELDRIGADRDLTLIYADQPQLLTGLPVPPRPDGRADGGATALVRIDWWDGGRTEVRLADQHPHGTWVEWLVP